MQLYGADQSYARSLWRCVLGTYREQGVVAFYRSYPTTVAMNVPVFAVYFAAYERIKRVVAPVLHPGGDEEFVPSVHCVAGGLAGALAAACSNPLDVIKTRLQVQRSVSMGAMACVRDLWAREGIHGFLRGLWARVIYQAPASACSWLAYEYTKHLLTAPTFGGYFLDDEDDDDDDDDDGEEEYIARIPT
mmetsp:Transcript_56927/g.149994  ORF Transcript_56927/g.149994 Transcript_56927/m.149994 type:complete len:190 (+) Transcript_56927:152-721(+)